MNWTARDWRQFVAITLMALGNVPLTAGIYYAQYAVQMDRENGNAFWLGIACAILVGMNFTGLSAILGRRTFKIKGAGGEMEMSGDTGEMAMTAVEQNSQ